jgi:hypothetical protein
MTKILNISCDEAGHTGPDLLQKEQRYFAYGSVSVDDAEAWTVIHKAVTDHHVQMPELKAARLMRSAGGRALIADLVKASEGRFALNVHDKLLALCGWVFEYIYEPVYQADPSLLYRKNLHRFLAMFSYMWFRDAAGEAEHAIRQFQEYMRTSDESKAPLLFKRIQAPLGARGNEHPFELVLRFARGYRDVIVADNARLNMVLPDTGRWTLDLSTSAMWSHLNHWGGKQLPLVVRADTSKPIQASIKEFTGDENDPGIKRARLIGFKDRLGWKLAEPITFVDSRNYPAIQLADVIAGTMVSCLVNGVPDGFQDTVKRIKAGMLRDSIFPNYEFIDLRQRGPAINYFMLYDLAQRAESGKDPYVDLAAMYHLAEVSWAKGDFKASFGD